MNAPRDDSEGLRDRWTFETLLQHVAAIIEANDKRYEQRFTDSNTAVSTAINAAKTAVDAALSAAKEAVAKAEAASEKRFEGVNEFRGTLSDQQRTLMPRAEADLRMATIERDLQQLKSLNIERRAQGQGMASLWGWIIGVIGLALAIASRFIK